MSALRLATPTQPVRYIDLGPASPAPLRGYSHRPHGIPGGSFCRPLPTTASGQELTPALRAKWREDKQRTRGKETTRHD